MPATELVKFKQIRRGGQCRLPGDPHLDRTWTRMTGGFASWHDCEGRHGHEYHMGMETLVKPCSPEDLTK